MGAVSKNLWMYFKSKPQGTRQSGSSLRASSIVLWLAFDLATKDALLTLSHDVSESTRRLLLAQETAGHSARVA